MQNKLELENENKFLLQNIGKRKLNELHRPQSLLFKSTFWKMR